MVAPRTKSVFGYFAERRVDLGPVTFTAGANLNYGCCSSLCLLDGDPFAAPKRALLVATGRAENTGMKWRHNESDPAGGNAAVQWELDSWGRAPTVVEAVPATVALPGSPQTLAVNALDARGQIAAPVAVRDAGAGRVELDIGKPQATL